MRIRLSEAAIADLRAIYRFGVEHFGVNAADAYASNLRRTIKSLADFPKAAPLRGQIRQPVRVRPAGSHVIVYIVDDQGIHVLRLRYAAEDWLDNPAGDHR